MMGFAFCGPAGCGKTSLAKYLVENYGFERFCFAEGVKKIAVDYFGMVGKDRSLLQSIGQGLRQIDPDVWVNYVVDRIDGHQFVVVDDMRYPNEYEALKKLGFVIIKLVGRETGTPMTEEQRSHASEQYWQMMNEDFVIDASKELYECFDQLEMILAKSFIGDMNLDMNFMEKIAERRIDNYYHTVKKINKGNKNYVRGRNFEYRTAKLLRKFGFHVMRKFGSKDDVWRIGGDEVHVPVDLTAYGHGLYLIISCKYSIKGPTTWIVDRKWRNLVEYSKLYGENCIPVFAGVNDKRRPYFVNLNTLKPIDIEALTSNINLRNDATSESEKSEMQKLLDWAWTLLEILKAEYDKAADDDNLRAKWAMQMVTLTNNINRIIYRTGDTGAKEDLTKFVEKAIEMIEKEEKEVEDNLVP